MIGINQKQPIVPTYFKYQWNPDSEEIVDEIIIDEDDDNDDDKENVLPLPPNMLVIDQDEHFKEAI